MCDCETEKKDDDKAGDPETVMLFKKCAKSNSPGQDLTRVSSDTVVDNTCIPGDSSQSGILAYTVCDSNKRSLATSSSYSSSTKTYKFVSPRECESVGEGEEVAWHPPVFTYEPCVEEEEVEEKPDIECTLAIVKPEAVIYKRQIERRIFEEGFEIYQTRWVQLTPEQVSEFYSDKYGQMNFAHLVAYMASGPVIVYVLAKRHGIKEWKLLIGPTKVAEARLYYPDCIRARYGRRGDDFKNAVHGSNTREEAETEIRFFFPNFVIEPLLKNDAAVDYLWEVLNSVLVEALSLCCKLKPADPVLWLANWLITNNPNKPKLPQDLATIPA